MANTIRIPRSVSTNTPASLAQGELAFSESGSPNGVGELFIGVAGPGVQKIATLTGAAAAEPNDSAQDNQVITTGLGIDGADAGDATAITISFASTELATTAIVATDHLVFDDATDNLPKKALLSGINLSLFNDDLGHVENATHTGEVTGATALSLDITAITNQPAHGIIAATDTILSNDGGVLSEATFTQMITFFDANLTFGQVDSVGAGVGLIGSGTAADPILTLDFTELTDMVASVSGTTEIILNDAGTESRKAISEIGLSFFNDDLGHVENVPTALSEGTRTGTTYGITSDGSADDILLPVFNTTQAGLSPSSGGGTANFLRADGTWAAPPGGASSMTYQGGYNASTNTPALDTGSPSITIGDTYTVTVAGTFFTVAVEVGDVLIAEVTSVDAAAVTDWTIVQTNIDAASETAAGYIELATQGEMDTATDDVRAVTPLKYANSTIDGGTF